MPRCSSCSRWFFFFQLRPSGRCKKCEEYYKLELEISREKYKEKKRKDSELTDYFTRNPQPIRQGTNTTQFALPTITISAGGSTRTITLGQSHNRAPSIGQPVFYLDFLVKTQNHAYISLDLETTGLSPLDSEIIEIGAAKVENGIVTDVFNQLVKPRNPIPVDATKINHITNDMVADKPSISEVLPAFLAFIQDLPCIAHNAHFDIGFLSQAVFDCKIDSPKIRYADSLYMAKNTWYGLNSYKLSRIADHLGIEMANAHRASDDAVCVAQIVEKAREQQKSEINRLTLKPRIEEWLASNIPCVQKDIALSFPDDEKTNIRFVINLLEKEGLIDRTKQGSSYLILPPIKPLILQKLSQDAPIIEYEFPQIFPDYAPDLITDRLNELSENGFIDRLFIDKTFVIDLPLRERLLKFIDTNSPCLQTDIKNAFPHDKPDTITKLMKHLSDNNIISRIRKGHTYEVRLNNK